MTKLITTNISIPKLFCYQQLKKAAMQFLFSVQTSLAAIFASFVLVYLLQKLRNAHIRTPPEAPGAWPIIGHLHMLGGTSILHQILGSMADKLGPIFTVKLGLQPTLVVSNWEIAKECFTTHDKAFATRPKSIAAEVMGYKYATFGLAPYDPYWRDLRKMTTRELLSQRRLAMLSHIRQSEVKTSINELYEQWAEKKNKDGWMSVEMDRWFADITLNVIARMLAGKRYKGETQESVRFKKAMKEFVRYLGMFLVSDGIPFLRWLDLGGHEQAMKRTSIELDSILESWLDEHKKKRLNNCGGMVKESEQDFMDVMLSILTEDIGGFDVDTINKAMCLVVLSAGTDTTTITMSWVLSLLLNNRHVLKKAIEEIDTHVGRGRRIEESDIKNLVYLDAILRETMRLYPSAPLSLPHESMEDCTVAGYHIPKGTRLVINISKIQSDPSVWSDPHEFRPERFLTTHKDVDVKGKHFELIPFGSGRRMCPGMNLSLRVMQLTLASLLHGFEFTSLSDEPIDMTESFGLSNHKANPLDVLVTPRLSSNLYR